MSDDCTVHFEKYDMDMDMDYGYVINSCYGYGQGLLPNSFLTLD